MQEGSKHLGVPFVAHDQPAEALEPGDGTFDFPTSTITSEASTVLSFDLFVPAVGANQLNSSSLQPGSKRVTVSRSIVNQSFGILSWSTTSDSRHRDLLQSRFNQCAFMGRR